MILGLHGRMTAGKDTVLERLRLISDSFARFAFADKLKISAMASLGFRGSAEKNNLATDEELIGFANLLKEYGTLTVMIEVPATEDTPAVVIEKVITGREYLQYCGTEGGRDVFGADFWVDQAMKPALEAEQAGAIPASTDTRFPNEAEAVLAADGEVWEIVGPVSDTGTHESETPLPPELITLTIDNTVRDDDFKHLDAQLERLVKERLHGE